MAFSRDGQALMVVECKAPDVPISQGVFDQAARYNKSFIGKYLVVTNGLEHYACEIDHPGQQVRFLSEIPDYLTIKA